MVNRKNNWLKKFIGMIVVIAVVMAFLPIYSFASGATENVADEAGLLAAAANANEGNTSKIVLDNDITITNFLGFHKNANVEIDLNGHNITSDVAYPVMVGSKASASFTGTGTIKSTHANGVAISVMGIPAKEEDKVSLQ
ncbi:MAG: hypothetical protein Q4E28_00295 [Clostridia bacterium]|nr:hypothetical protein [Clostridia bacterium]